MKVKRQHVELKNLFILRLTTLILLILRNCSKSSRGELPLFFVIFPFLQHIQNKGVVTYITQIKVPIRLSYTSCIEWHYGKLDFQKQSKIGRIFEITELVNFYLCFAPQIQARLKIKGVDLTQQYIDRLKQQIPLHMPRPWFYGGLARDSPPLHPLCWCKPKQRWSYKTTKRSQSHSCSWDFLTESS